MLDTYRDRKWVVAVESLPAAAGIVARLQAWGGQCLVLAARAGTGAAPEAPHAVLGLPPKPMMEALQSAEDALRALPPALQEAVERFDPERTAQVVGTIFSDGRPVAGRRFFGARDPRWLALEDKVVVDDLWDELGVPRAPRQVVDVEPGALAAAHRALDAGAGTVWAADASQGFHGGATYTFRVRDIASAGDVVASLRRRARRARVMPFLEGVPCSIHGIVLPDHVIVLRPAELVVLRHPSGRFVYGRAATFWDPPGPDRTALRALARRVGAHLRATVDYRGAFTIDGVLTSAGFSPTELNPRIGAALGLMHRGVSFHLLNCALLERDLGLDGPALEHALVTEADAHRQGALGFTFAGGPGPDAETQQVYLAWRDGGWRQAEPEEVPDAAATVGPGSVGGYAMLRLAPDRTPVGQSVAARAVAFTRWLDETVDAGLGPLEGYLAE